jgi:hypothetical protein
VKHLRQAAERKMEPGCIFRSPAAPRAWETRGPMPGPVFHSLRSLRGAWNLLLLGVATRFRLRGKYWSWRMETAFGADRSKWPPARERRRAALEYGAWVGSMRKLMRG